MTPAQIDFLRDFAINRLPRAQADREQINRLGGNLYERLAFTAVLIRGKAGTTATEYAAANVLESVCLLQQPLQKNQRTDTLHNLTGAANALCLHSETSIPWLEAAAQPEPETEPPAPAVQVPLPSIAGRSLTTAEAAQASGFAVQTLRKWASTETGPFSSTKVARRLKWSGDDILAALKKR